MHTVSLTPPAARRRGFTLIELLAVIAILSILMAFLVPAVLNARRAALVTQVTSDILTLDNGIKAFKNEFGVEPPSSIKLYEAAAGWTTAESDTVEEALRVKSVAIIGRIWPQFVFNMARDINDDGDQTDEFTLNGSECLVFFLGGVSRQNSGTWIPNGFSRNPADPFAQTGTNRLTILTDLKTDRLIDSPTNSHFFSYADPIAGTKVPYLYVSSYEGQGYNENPTANQYAFDIAIRNTSNVVLANVSDARGQFLASAPANDIYTPHYYRQGPNISTVPSSSPFWNKNSYQIISAGFDRRFGGPSTSGTMPYQFGGDWQKGEGLPTSRDGERDNITNFSSGLLEP